MARPRSLRTSRLKKEKPPGERGRGGEFAQFPENNRQLALPHNKGIITQMVTYCNNVCKRAVLRLVYWLARLTGVPVLPAGWMMFDPALAVAVGVNQAILHQHINGWIQHNERRGHNRRAGRTWTYNSAAAWAKALPWLHEKTVAKYLRELRAGGWLEAAPLAARKNDRTLWYATGAQDSKGGSGSRGRLESAAGVIGANDSNVPMDKPTKKPYRKVFKPNPPAATRHGAGAAGKTTKPLKTKMDEMPEAVAAEPEGREGRDERAEGVEIEALRALGVTMPADNLRALMEKHGLATIEGAIRQARGERDARNPVGLALWRLENGARPTAAGQGFDPLGEDGKAYVSGPLAKFILNGCSGDGDTLPAAKLSAAQV